MRMIEEIQAYLKNHTIEETLIEYEDKVLEANIAALSIWFCSIFENANIKKHQEIVIKGHDPRQYYNFARNVKGTDIRLLKESAFVFKDARVMILFASSFPEYGIDKEQEFIIGLNDPELAYLFAFCVKGADIEALEDIVIASGDYKTAYSFALIKGANIKPLEDIVVESNDPLYIFLFAKNVKGANIKRLYDKLVELGDVSQLLKFCKEIHYVKYEIIRRFKVSNPVMKKTLDDGFNYSRIFYRRKRAK